MNNRNIVMTAILSLLGRGGLSCTALAAILPPPLIPQTVILANTATEPVPIRDAENPARQAAQQELDLVFGPFNGITIPAGRIFVLETVSFQFNGGGVASLDSLSIGVIDPVITGRQGSVDHFLVIPPPNSAGIIQGSQALRRYAQPGTILGVNQSVSGNGPKSFAVSFSGYFVSAQ
jgi:hypothetical protein